jgi:hypothetical protein
MLSGTGGTPCSFPGSFQSKPSVPSAEPSLASEALHNRQHFPPRDLRLPRAATSVEKRFLASLRLWFLLLSICLPWHPRCYSGSTTPETPCGIGINRSAGRPRIPGQYCFAKEHERRGSPLGFKLVTSRQSAYMECVVLVEPTRQPVPRMFSARMLARLTRKWRGEIVGEYGAAWDIMPPISLVQRNRAALARLRSTSEELIGALKRPFNWFARQFSGRFQI